MRNSTGVADLGSLLSDQGVPLDLDKGNNHVVVLFPPRCCNHHGSRVVPQWTEPPLKPLLKFDTAEHIITTAGCKLKMANGDMVDALTKRLLVGPALELTYGQVIALGGDFYGDPEHPVCNAGSQEQQIEQFQKNFASLQSSAVEVKKILAIANHSRRGIPQQP